MSLRNALLALLEARPMTGYELAKQFDTSVNYVWHATHSQIYPALRRLEEEGLVDAETSTRGRHATKRTYSITDAGCEELEAWVDAVQQPVRPRSAEYMKATYFEFASFDTVRRQYEAHLAYYRQQEQLWSSHADALESRSTALIKRRLERAPAEARDAIVAYKVHVYRGLVEQARGEVEWARRGLELVDQLQSAMSAGDAARPVRPRPS